MAEDGGPVLHKDRAPHYRWQGNCDAWALVARPDLSVKQERMPAGAVEVAHRHRMARQVFYVLEGRLTLVLEDQSYGIGPGEAIEVPPGTLHQARNASLVPVMFLVISCPDTEGDRHEVRLGA